MISFYPGPSQLHPQMGFFMQKAHESGILSANHRSAQVINLIKETVQLFREKQNLPAGYEIYFVSSTTEAWEIVIQSLVAGSIYHYASGSFGTKWATGTTHLIGAKRVIQIDFYLNNNPTWHSTTATECLAVVHNETSNGSIVSLDNLPKQEGLILVDAVSSMGAMEMPWKQADAWLCSIQKALGLPAGMGLLICSPKAIEKAKELNQDLRYNSIVNQHQNMAVFQTTHTPNVLGIYLLNQVLGCSSSIVETHMHTIEKAKNWISFFENNPYFSLLVTNSYQQSPTVFALKGSVNHITSLKKHCAQAGFILGNGYGIYKDSTFRIANFPAHTLTFITQLQSIINQFTP